MMGFAALNPSYGANKFKRCLNLGAGLADYLLDGPAKSLFSPEGDTDVHS
jgi:hypothetical protein